MNVPNPQPPPITKGRPHKSEAKILNFKEEKEKLLGLQHARDEETETWVRVNVDGGAHVIIVSTKAKGQEGEAARSIANYLLSKYQRLKSQGEAILQYVKWAREKNPRYVLQDYSSCPSFSPKVVSLPEGRRRDLNPKQP